MPIRWSMSYAFALLLCLSTSAVAGSFAGSSAGASSGGSSATTGSSSSSDDKRLIQARSDAARFVASDGQLRGARLEAAFRHLRQQPEFSRRDDLSLARYILAL